ncbi:hypothetical protein DSECCO2_48850 [anaerobic digester metagenome]
MRKFGIYKLRLKNNSAELIKFYSFDLESMRALEDYFENMKKELVIFKDHGFFWNNNVEQFLPIGGFFDHIIKLRGYLYLIFPDRCLESEPKLYEINDNKFIKLTIRDVSKLERFMGKIFDRETTKYFTDRIAQISSRKNEL